MKSKSSLQFMWFLNAGLILAAVYTGYWAFTAEASQPSIKKHRPTKARAKDDTPTKAKLERRVNAEELRKVFVRRFAPPGAKDLTNAELKRQMLERLVPVKAPLPPRAEVVLEKAPETAPTLPPQPDIVKPAGPTLESLISVVVIFFHPDENLSAVVVLKKKTREQNLCMLGERPQDLEAKVVQIKVDAADFEYLGKRVTLKLEEQKKIPGSTAYNVRRPEPDQQTKIDPKYHKVVKRTDVMQAMSRPVEAMKGIKYAIVRVEDRVVGFKIGGVTNSSIFSRYGMKNNDIVRAVNGRPLDETFNPILMMTDIVSSDVIRVDLRRYNRDITLTFELGQ
jgi:type II secretory pathway component PulC